jgi:hypothetical protein
MLLFWSWAPVFWPPGLWFGVESWLMVERELRGYEP